MKLVIFDMDGLLFDTEWPSFQALKEAVERRGFTFTIENYKQLIGLAHGKSMEVMQQMYGGKLPYEEIIIDYRKRFKEILANDGVGIKRGAIKLLDALDQRGMKKCIASSSARETIASYLKLTGLEDRFDFYISGNEVKKGKPHPDIFLEACKIAGEPVESALVLEDSLNGLKAACAAEIRCILVPDLIDPTEEMKEKAYKIIEDLEKVIEVLE
ncbi:HAD superfamily hydrolase (TIGR01509 family) [Bacillus niacini]|uniref:HAD superfamily hydrolase (TIGR01509 family) n=1 Tax=Neobacillus niacini TaxID=86668 RepID=A0A852TEB1_9BACI|nr:HAD family phosphatase [Neobacillus niacini]NYE06007.1 HAD superfamily hydrolase (TIGR01509 family) [Neobacillus niacini]